MLDDDEFAEVCPTLARWELLCVAFSAYLRERTGLPVDFQIQRTREANEKYVTGRVTRSDGAHVRGRRRLHTDWTKGEVRADA